jgi:PAS domain S-box-containing protein
VQTRCFTRDVTERLRAERALREIEERAHRSQALLAAIVESSDDAIVSKSLDGRITSWNRGATRLFGYTAEEALGRRITLVIPPENEHEEQHILEKLARGERIEHFETVRVAKDGRRIDVSLSISPIRDRDGKVVGASKVARDVSERKCMEAKLRDADRRKDEFIAVLGHELRNPLGPIRSIAEVLQRTASGTPGMERLCTILERQVAQMTRLLDDLLDVSRITRGRIKFQREPLDLVQVVQRAVEASRPLLERHRHDLRITLPTAAAHMQGDAARLVQMVTNLLNNAAKYTPEPGRIALRVVRKRKSFEIRVKDNGVGIAPGTLDDIFELFVQGERTGGQAPEGLGIGLTMVRMIAEHHGGSVKAQSAGCGRGSEFIVTLPAACEAAPARIAAAQTPARAKEHKRILILDDNRDSSESLAALLRVYGHDVFVAADGASGVNMIEALDPDLALLDIGLPDIDGYEVARRLRTKGCNVPLAALTGYGTPEDRERARSAGFDHHFVKPIDPLALERLIGSLP